MAMDLYLLDNEIVAETAWSARVVWLRQAGIAGVSLPLEEPATVQDMRGAVGQLDAARIKLVSLRLTLDVHREEAPLWLSDMLAALTRGSTIIELRLRSSSQHDAPSSPRGDARAAELVKRVLERARSHGLAVSLSHRSDDWMARIDDAVRLAMRLNRPTLGLTFNVAHWRRLDGRHLDASLHLAAPRMALLTVGGDEADLSDARAALRTGARLGYRGPVGLEMPGGMVEPALLRQAVARIRGPQGAKGGSPGPGR